MLFLTELSSAFFKVRSCGGGSLCARGEAESLRVFREHEEEECVLLVGVALARPSYSVPDFLVACS